MHSLGFGVPVFRSSARYGSMGGRLGPGVDDVLAGRDEPVKAEHLEEEKGKVALIRINFP